jgi:hypothetical protein
VKVQILNQSTLVPQTTLQPIVQALQQQVTDDFAPIYGSACAADLTLTASDNGDIPIYIVDDDASAPAGALAWHTVDAKGRPYGMIPAKIVQDAGADLGPTISHELLELLADPSCSKVTARVYRPTVLPLLAEVAYEVCDPVEADTYSKTTDGGIINVSNFVLPAWFNPTGKVPFDFLDYLNMPLQMTEGGYVSWSYFGKTWQQKVQDELQPLRECDCWQSRRTRRKRAVLEKSYPGMHASLLKIAVPLDAGSLQTLLQTLLQELGPVLVQIIEQVLSNQKASVTSQG